MQPMSGLQEQLPRALLQAAASGEILSQEATLLLVAAALPGRMRPAQVHAQIDPAGDGLPVIAHGLHPLDNPTADGPHSVRAASRCGAAHRPGPPARSGSCSGHGAASFLFLEPGNQQSGHDSRIWPDLALPWRSVLEMVVLAGQGRRQVFGNSSHGLMQLLRCRCLLSDSDGRRTWRARFGCLVSGAANSTRIPPCPFKLFAF